MKRIISLLLILVLITTSCGSALADTLTLPAQIKIIGEEAFAGDTSLDEVVLPSGAQSIQSRAFADSSLQKITIPDSVTDISADAFSGADNTVIYSSAEAYAHTYAVERQIPWEELDDGALDVDSLYLQGLDFTPFDVSAETDPDKRQALIECNEQLAVIEDAAREYNLALDEAFGAFSEVSDYLAGSVSSTGSAVTWGGSSAFTIRGGDLLDENANYTMGEVSEINGQTVMELTGGGASRYMIVKTSGITITDTKPGQSRASGMTQTIYPDEEINPLLQNIQNGVDTITSVLSRVEDSLNIATECSHLIDEYGNLMMTVASENDFLPAASRWTNIQRNNELGRNMVSSLRRNIAARIVAIGNEVAQISNAVITIRQLQKIRNHHHPVDNEADNPECMNIITEMNSKINRAIWALTANAFLSIFDIFDEVCKIADKIPGAKVQLAAARAGIRIAWFALHAAVDIGLGVWGDSLVNDVKALDGMLHGYVISGTVIDRLTMLPVAGVKVTSNGASTITDEKGYYYLYYETNGTAIDSVTIKFGMDGYKTERITKNISRYSTNSEVQSMKPFATISGYVDAQEEGNLANPPLAGVYVYYLDDGAQKYCATTDERGNYTASVPGGDTTLIFKKPGYDSVTKTVHVNLNGEDNGNKNARLKQNPNATPGPIVPGETTPPPTPTVNPNDIPIDAAHFPDAAFREIVMEFDKNSDGLLSESEREAVIEMTITHVYVYSTEYFFEGINYFHNLRTIIFDGRYFWATNIDLSNYTSLVSLTIKAYNTYDHAAVSLDLSNCTSLVNLTIDSDWINSLNVSGCTALPALGIFYSLDNLVARGCTSLTELDWRNRNLTSLDVSNCTALTKLGCYSNQLTNLEVSGCTALTNLSCYGNQLTSLDLSGCTALTNLSCYSNQLTSLNLSDCTALTNLSCYSNQLTSLDLSDCTALTDLSCGNNQLTSLDVSGCTALTSLYCGGNQLTSLDVSHCPALYNLSCGNNQLTSLDVSRCPLLIYLYCCDNQLTSLDVSRCPLLIYLYCYDNQLTSLDVSDYPALIELSCIGNQLTNLDVSGCTSLVYLNCYNNQLTRLDVSGCTSLVYLNCYNNQLTRLDVSGCTFLTSLYCFNNLLTSLDASGCTSLVYLNCYNNQLTSLDASGFAWFNNFRSDGNFSLSLDLSGCTTLTEIFWWEHGLELTSTDTSGGTVQAQLWLGEDDNQLIITSLDISGCTALTTLWCLNTQLTSLNVSGCTALTSLYCFDNQLTSLDVSGCTVLTELNCGGNQLTSLDLNGCTALTKLGCVWNQLTSLDVSHCPVLENLSCYGNQLTSLDVSHCPALTKLYCGGNQLTSLNVKSCTALKELSCSNNSILSLNAEGMSELIYLDCSDNRLIALRVRNCENLETLRCNNNRFSSLNVSGCVKLTEENIECDLPIWLVY